MRTLKKYNLLTARLRLLSAEEGGRKTAVVAGYRPPLYMDARSSECVLQEIVGSDKIVPGGERLVSIFVLRPENLGDSVVEGKEFELREGSRVVARGIIVELGHLEIERLVTRQ